VIGVFGGERQDDREQHARDDQHEEWHQERCARIEQSGERREKRGALAGGR